MDDDGRAGNTVVIVENDDDDDNGNERVFPKFHTRAPPLSSPTQDFDEYWLNEDELATRYVTSLLSGLSDDEAALRLDPWTNKLSSASRLTG